MKRILLAILLLLPSLSYAQPSISFDAEKHNFGSVSALYLEHAFVFTNTGNQDLIIESVTPS
ncbi:MAG: DUF1573 domain-containing protein [Nitrospirota bacterium]